MSAIPEEMKSRLQRMLFAEEKNRIRVVRFGIVFRCFLREGYCEPEDRDYLLLDETGKPAVLGKEHAKNLFLVRKGKENAAFILEKFLPAKGTSVCCIPSVITELAEQSFRNCDSLRKVVIPDWAFWCCPMLTEIVLPENRNYQIIAASDGSRYLFAKESRTVIRYLVQEKERTYISLPVGTQRIGRGAFSGAKDFRKVYPDRALKWIGMGEFDGCQPGACYSGSPRGDCLCENRDGNIISWQEMRRR